MSPEKVRSVRSVLVAHPSAELYGSDRVMLETVAGLTERGVSVTVSLPSPGPLVDALRERGAEVRFAPSPVVRKSALRPAGMARLLADVARGMPATIRMISRVDPDVVLVNTLTIPLWVFIGRLLRRRVVCHVHEAEQSAPAVLRRLLAAPLLLAHDLIVNSEFSLGVLRGSFVALGARSTVIYNGVPGPADPVPARADLSGSPLQIVYVGRISPRKGPEIVIDAVRLLVERGTDVRLDVVGSVFLGYEWFERHLTAKVHADTRLSKRIEFHGFVDDVWPYLDRSDVVVVPSQVDEPFGNTAVEAVLAARPAIVSATSGLLEAARGYDSVVNVRPGDPVALADAVDAMVEQWPTYSQRTAAALREARARHSPATYRRKVARLVLGRDEPIKST